VTVRGRWTLIAGGAIGLFCGTATADPLLLRTTFPLDEPRGYCVDISGFAATLRLEEPLQAHTPAHSRRSTPSSRTSTAQVARYHHSLGHNHTSQLLSFGTADVSVSAEVVDFIERSARR
jgi:hypothetical protein